MSPNSFQLSPIPELSPVSPPELKDEALLVLQMALQPLDPSTARAYARKEYPIYALLLVAFSLPVLLGGMSFLMERGFPAWLIQLGFGLLLAAFFVFFFAMIAFSLSRNKILPSLGILPVEKNESEISSDVAMLADRRGRKLEYGVSQTRNFWRYRQAAPLFLIENRGGNFFASSGLPRGIHNLLSSLPKDRLWRRLYIRGDSEGVETSRPIRLAKFYLQDLWLLEKILDVIGMK